MLGTFSGDFTAWGRTVNGFQDLNHWVMKEKKNTSLICVVGSPVHNCGNSDNGPVGKCQALGTFSIFSKLLPWFTYLGAITGLYSNWTHKLCKLLMVISQ